MMGSLFDGVGILAAALGGAAVGVERQWSGHASGPTAHFGGVRTFALLGGLGGIAGWLWHQGQFSLATVVLAGATALVVLGYLAASRRDVDGTTEAAALVVLAAGTLAGAGDLPLASGIIALTGLLLIEKSRLHAVIQRLDEPGLRAAVRFGVMALVVLPVLPGGPYGPWGGVRPQMLWGFVLLFTGISFAGHVARSAVGPGYGFPVAGLLGGLVSSTAVTLAFARMSRTEPGAGRALALGVTGACAMVAPRVLATTAVLNPSVGRALLPYLLPPLAAGVLVVTLGLLQAGRRISHLAAPANPLEFTSALRTALLFQVVLFAVHAIHATFGDLGVLASGALVGLVEPDAVVLSMTMGTSGVSAAVAAEAIALAVLANGLLKLALAVILGGRGFRLPAALGVGALCAVTTIALGLARLL